MSKAGFFAELLNKSMKGIGTKDGDLIRILVSQSEICLGEVTKKYQEIYKKSLHDAVKGDLSGSYEVRRF